MDVRNLSSSNFFFLLEWVALMAVLCMVMLKNK